MHVCMLATPKLLTQDWFCFAERRGKKIGGRRKVLGLKLEAYSLCLVLNFLFFFLPWQLVQLPKSKYIFCGAGARKTKEKKKRKKKDEGVAEEK